uniref:Major facilitator superfamily (MFS) profile domain-containing protein n=1 Tax=Aegilops tauschii TaxID=37682 RepID=N1R4T1_AEGTA
MDKEQQRHGELEAPLLPGDGGKAAAAAGSAYALVCSLVASAISVIYGYNRGVMSGAQKFVQDDLGISDAQIEVLIGATSIYSLVGSLAAGWACDCAGRRRTMALSAAMFFAGSAITSVAGGYAVLMAGQLVAGVACGFGLVVAPVYIAEMAPAASRGFLSSIPEIAGNAGILLSYIADFALAGFPNNVNWRLMIGVGAVPPLFLAVATLLAMPETPLVESSKQAVPGGSDERTRSTSVWRDILIRPTRSVRRVLLAILGLQFFQQASGVAALVLYAPRVFHHAGVTSQSAGTGIGTAVNRVMSAVVGMTFISLYEAVGMAGSFYIFAGCAAASWVFVYALLPETKGRTLEEMEALFDDSANDAVINHVRVQAGAARPGGSL